LRGVVVMWDGCGRGGSQAYLGARAFVVPGDMMLMGCPPAGAGGAAAQSLQAVRCCPARQGVAADSALVGAGRGLSPHRGEWWRRLPVPAGHGRSCERSAG